MARVQHVKKAQQRYRTVPVLDETGQPQRIPIMARSGQQKVTRTGRPVFRTLTREDRERPLPLRVCDAPGCGRPIEVGTPYKYIDVKTGARSSRTLARHEGCPTWQPWELSNSLSARITRIQYTSVEHVDQTDPAAVADALHNAAEEIRELAEEKREAAQNMEDGFGHETEQSAELADVADQLETWADEVSGKGDEAEGLEVPEEETDCGTCGGTGRVSGDADEDEGVDECSECGGTGQVDNPELDDFHDELAEALSILDESPV